ncbi:hypothetical protein F5Y17DRAFT_459898 [Xylariaceae sp. FL0594]|nr:hypothetical protein F5Y17DRAFT_459898 [Xylariaceae sp. FL0594]
MSGRTAAAHCGRILLAFLGCVRAPPRRTRNVFLDCGVPAQGVDRPFCSCAESSLSGRLRAPVAGWWSPGVPQFFAAKALQSRLGEEPDGGGKTHERWSCYSAAQSRLAAVVIRSCSAGCVNHGGRGLFATQGSSACGKMTVCHASAVRRASDAVDATVAGFQKPMSFPSRESQKAAVPITSPLGQRWRIAMATTTATQRALRAVSGWRLFVDLGIALFQLPEANEFS